jgi:ABC-2 type transport system ATP-binding protein
MLELVGLHKRYGQVVALDGAGFGVSPGRILGFVGPNGAGKTTAMRCVFGLVTPEAGEVRWDGRPVTDQDRLRFGYMPEERGLYPKMKVREQMVYFGRLSGMASPDASAAADRWLSRLDLAGRADAKVEDLSHGNQQRVQLAVALIHDPEVAVLDEPFSGLDPLGVVALSETLRGIAKDGAAIVFSSHQLDLVEDVCQDVAIIDQGRVVVTGDLETLREQSQHRRLAVTVNGSSWVPSHPDVTVVDNGVRSHCIVGRDAPVDELLAAAKASGEVNRFVFEPPSLSDLFVEAVAR